MSLRYIATASPQRTVPNWVAALPRPDSWHGVLFDDGLPVVQGRYGADYPSPRGVMHFRLIPDDLELGGHATVEAAMRADCDLSWLHAVMPDLLASDRVDAMAKLRLAARWVEGDMTDGG